MLRRTKPNTAEIPHEDPLKNDSIARKDTGIARTVRKSSAMENDIDPVSGIVGKYPPLGIRKKSNAQ